MATALFTVKATIPPDREKEFNEWYNHTHIPDVMKFGGVVSARRYKAFIPEDRFQYIAVYEFESRETLERFIASDHMTWLRADLDKHFGAVCERQRAAYEQVWP